MTDGDNNVAASYAVGFPEFVDDLLETVSELQAGGKQPDAQALDAAAAEAVERYMAKHAKHTPTSAGIDLDAVRKQVEQIVARLVPDLIQRHDSGRVDGFRDASGTHYVIGPYTWLKGAADGKWRRLKRE